MGQSSGRYTYINIVVNITSFLNNSPGVPQAKELFSAIGYKSMNFVQEPFNRMSQINIKYK